MQFQTPISTACYFLAIIALAIVGLSAWTFKIHTYDPFWLMAMGREHLAGVTTQIDQYSFTFSGHPVSGSYHYFGSILYWLVNTFGLEPAARILRTGAVACLIALAFYTRKERKIDSQLALAISFILVGIHYRFFLRPELFDYVFVGAAFYLYRRALDQLGKIEFFLICGLLFLWNNFHAAILGYVIFFGLYCQLFSEMLKAEKKRELIKIYMISGFILISLGFIRPDFSHPIIEGITFADGWGQLIREHFTFSTRFDFERNGLAYIIFPTAALVIFLSLRAGHVGLAAITLIFLLASWERVRMLSFLVEIIGFSILILTESREKIVVIKGRSHTLSMAGSSALCLGAAILIAPAADRAQTYAGRETTLPREITEFLKANHRQGNIFNTMHFGGWLLYSLHPDFKVYIDGRTNILYPLQHLQENVRIANGDTETLIEVLGSGAVDFLLLENRKNAYTNIILHSEFRSEYITEVATLYSKTEQSLRFINLLLNYPSCWDDSFLDDVQAERDIALTRYSDQSNSKTFIEEFARSNLSQISSESLAKLADRHKRAVAFRLLDNEKPIAAMEAMDAIVKKDNLDLIAYSFMAMEANNWREAKLTSLAVISGMWNELINPDADPLTSEQLSIFSRVARIAMQRSDDTDIDHQLIKWLEARGLNEVEDSTQDSLIYREHCNSLVRAVSGDTWPVKFTNIGFEKYEVTSDFPAQ